MDIIFFYNIIFAFHHCFVPGDVKSFVSLTAKKIYRPPFFLNEIEAMTLTQSLLPLLRH